MKKTKAHHFLPALIFFFFTFYLFTLPGEDIPQISWLDKINGDKLVHAAFFFILLFLLGYPFNKSQYGSAARLKWFFFFMATGITYGIAVEFIQKKFIPHRSFDIGDIIADTIGCVAGYTCIVKIFLGKEQEKNQQKISSFYKGK